MPTSKNKKPVFVDRKLCERFSYLYPDLLAKFCERAILLSIQDKTYFEKVFFNPIFMEVK